MSLRAQAHLVRRRTTRRSHAFRAVGAGATRDRQGARFDSPLLMSDPQRKQYRSTSFFQMKPKNGALRAQPRQKLLESYNDWGAADARTPIVRTTPSNVAGSTHRNIFGNRLTSLLSRPRRISLTAFRFATNLQCFKLNFQFLGAARALCVGGLSATRTMGQMTSHQ